MKKILMLVAFVTTCGSALSNDLAQADKLFAQANYAQALQMYTSLANAGNAQAQLKLGELYWYGEAGGVDLVKAELWLKKAAAQGNNSASSLLALIAQRALRQKDIEYYTAHFDGGEVQLSRLGCVYPAIPERSQSNSEIKRVNEEVKNWGECYQRFVSKIQSVMPPGKVIPADLVEVMSNDDITQAKETMDKTYSSITARVAEQTQALTTKYRLWQSATVEFVTTQNEMQRREYEAQVARNAVALAGRDIDASRAATPNTNPPARPK